MKAKFKLYSDGSINAKTGQGAFGFLVIKKHGEEDVIVTEKVRVEAKTTISVMEMKAVLHGLGEVQRLAKAFGYSEVVVDVYSDSKMLVDALNIYIHKWKKRAVGGVWHATNGAPVANQEIFKQIEAKEAEIGKVRYIHVKAHSDSDYNNRVDLLVRQAAFDLPMAA